MTERMTGKLNFEGNKGTNSGSKVISGSVFSFYDTHWLTFLWSLQDTRHASCKYYFDSKEENHTHEGIFRLKNRIHNWMNIIVIIIFVHFANTKRITGARRSKFAMKKLPHIGCQNEEEDSARERRTSLELIHQNRESEKKMNLDSQVYLNKRPIPVKRLANAMKGSNNMTREHKERHDRQSTLSLCYHGRMSSFIQMNRPPHPFMTHPRDMTRQTTEERGSCI